jgi:hypothetical protein
MTERFRGGIDIAMKVPPHQFEATVAFYRDVVGLAPIVDRPPATGFELGPNRLWIDEVAQLNQAEIWLELFTDDFPAAAEHLASARRRSVRPHRAASRRIPWWLDHQPGQHRPHGSRTRVTPTPLEPPHHTDEHAAPTPS